MTTKRRVRAGLRAAAAFEAAKGLIVFLVGFGLLSLLHHDAQRMAEAAVRHLHLNPARHYPRVFVEAAARVTDARLWLLAFGAALYATARGVEAYGLWRARTWAEWFAILSGGIYLPLEVYALIRHPTVIKAIIFVINAVIVVYVGYVRLASRRSE